MLSIKRVRTSSILDESKPPIITTPPINKQIEALQKELFEKINGLVIPPRAIQQVWKDYVNTETRQYLPCVSPWIYIFKTEGVGRRILSFLDRQLLKTSTFMDEIDKKNPMEAKAKYKRVVKQRMIDGVQYTKAAIERAWNSPAALELKSAYILKRYGGFKRIQIVKYKDYFLEDYFNFLNFLNDHNVNFLNSSNEEEDKVSKENINGLFWDIRELLKVSRPMYTVIHDISGDGCRKFPNCQIIMHKIHVISKATFLTGSSPIYGLSYLYQMLNYALSLKHDHIVQLIMENVSSVRCVLSGSDEGPSNNNSFLQALEVFKQTDLSSESDLKNDSSPALNSIFHLFTSMTRIEKPKELSIFLLGENKLFFIYLAREYPKVLVYLISRVLNEHQEAEPETSLFNQLMSESYESSEKEKSVFLDLIQREFPFYTFQKI